MSGKFLKVWSSNIRFQLIRLDILKYGFLYSYRILVFIVEQHSNRKFLQTMKIYILCSLVYCTNDLICGIHWFACTEVMYELPENFFPFHPSYAFMFHLVHIRTNLCSYLYAFGSFMEIYLTWSRIQIFRPNYTFLQNKSVT